MIQSPFGQSQGASFPSEFSASSPASMNFRIGSVSYLNARPLTYALGEEISLLEPSRLAIELSEGRLEAALVPLFEILENAHLYHLVDGLAIGSLNSVYSVGLAHQIAIPRLQSVSLDPASKTSNQLLRILLEKFHRLRPYYVAPDQSPDGRLIIGDPAIAFRRAHPDTRFYDLAAAWHAHTGLPFVFAAWAIRRDSPDPQALANRLRTAGLAGLAARDQIAQNSFERRYLYEHLYYRLNGPQKKAITTFAGFLVELGALSQTPQLSFL